MEERRKQIREYQKQLEELGENGEPRNILVVGRQALEELHHYQFAYCLAVREGTLPDGRTLDPFALMIQLGYLVGDAELRVQRLP